MPKKAESALNMAAWEDGVVESWEDIDATGVCYVH